jgi:hypothetical protein
MAEEHLLLRIRNQILLVVAEVVLEVPEAMD